MSFKWRSQTLIISSWKVPCHLFWLSNDWFYATTHRLTWHLSWIYHTGSSLWDKIRCTKLMSCWHTTNISWRSKASWNSLHSSSWRLKPRRCKSTSHCIWSSKLWLAWVHHIWLTHIRLTTCHKVRLRLSWCVPLSKLSHL